jgi:transcriptional regulator with XRE-family HTH domain
MTSHRPTPEAWGQTLAEALRAIRKARGLSTMRVATLMGMDRRNYANFETGKGRLNFERVLEFARVTDSDPWAILAAVLIGSPDLARNAADNKFVTVFLILLAEFQGEVRDEIRRVDTAEAVAAFRDAFKALEAAVASKKDRLPPNWLRDGAARVGLGENRGPVRTEPDGTD